MYLKMPFNSISALQKTLPLPTDLLSQPVQILITWKRFADVAFWNGVGAANTALLCNSFASASVNFRQTTLQNSEHLLARRENMNEKALTVPLRYFTQTAFRTTVTQAGGAKSQINLTGFRFGSVKYIDIWVRPVGAPAGWTYVAPSQLRLLINGLVMYDTQNSNNLMWSLCDRKTPAAVSTTALSLAPGGAGVVATPAVCSWVPIPFSQLSEPMAYSNDITLGYPIANSVINLELTMPADGQYEVTASYHYACALMASKGTMEYVF
jgi:hypothetical protein